VKIKIDIVFIRCSPFKTNKLVLIF